MNGRNGNLTPISVDSDWSPLNRFQNSPYDTKPKSPAFPPNQRPNNTPPQSTHTSASVSDGPMASLRQPGANGHPSPPSSIARSSDGTGLYASSMTESLSGRKAAAMEESLAEHYQVLKRYLGPYMRDEKGNPRPNRARDKLVRLSQIQFQELSTDVYDESIRREDERRRGEPGANGNDVPKYLLPKTNFHPKRNQARQKLSTLPLERFRQLATDVFYELERRFPRFTGGEMDRSASPALSMASNRSRGPGRGPPLSMSGVPGGPPGPNGYRGPPPGGRGGPQPPYRQGPPGSPGMGPGLGPPSQGGDFGRPLPKTFQQNTIVPNKGTLVEDEDDSAMDDDDDDLDSFGLEGAAARRSARQSARDSARQSRRGTNKGLRSASSDKRVTDLQNEVTELQNRLSTLELEARTKDNEIEKLQAIEKEKDDAMEAENAEFNDLRANLERQVTEAQELNQSLEDELNRVRSENLKVDTAASATLQRKHEELEKSYEQQQHVMDEVRRDAFQSLQEMRELSAQSDRAAEREKRMTQQISQLEAEVRDWKSRYAEVKTQLRSVKASSIGLAPEALKFLRNNEFTHNSGMVKDVNMSKFQFSVDELLQAAREANSGAVLDCMKAVVMSVRKIIDDVIPLNGEATLSKQHAKLKSRVSATANNLITAAKNHASAGGLSPVSLLDAAASHLATAVVELVRVVKIRPSPLGQHDNEEFSHDVVPDLNKALPTKRFTGMSSGSYSHAYSRSKGSVDSIGLSGYSQSPISSPKRTTGQWQARRSEGLANNSLVNGMAAIRDTGLGDFKDYLDDQTALLVQSIQPLVHSIRSQPANAHVHPDDMANIMGYVNDISCTVQDTVLRTREAIDTLGNKPLQKHATPVIDVLAECRQLLLEAEGAREKTPPLAFKTARMMKELVLRVERIESGELTADQTLSNDF